MTEAKTTAEDNGRMTNAKTAMTVAETDFLDDSMSAKDFCNGGNLASDFLYCELQTVPLKTQQRIAPAEPGMNVRGLVRPALLAPHRIHATLGKRRLPRW